MAYNASIHVVTADGGLLDGFTVQKGNAGAGYGGGVYVSSGDLLIANCSLST